MKITAEGERRGKKNEKNYELCSKNNFNRDDNNNFT